MGMGFAWVGRRVLGSLGTTTLKPPPSPLRTWTVGMATCLLDCLSPVDGTNARRGLLANVSRPSWPCWSASNHPGPRNRR